MQAINFREVREHTQQLAPFLVLHLHEEYKMTYVGSNATDQNHNHPVDTLQPVWQMRQY